MTFKIIKTEKTENGIARLGELETDHGTTQTPFFMPVATKLTVKHISPMEIKEMGGDACISNSYILYLRPGRELIKKAKGIHKFMNFKGVMFTDSGGFQIQRKTIMEEITDEGVKFKDPFSNRTHFLRPEDAMHMQREWGSDVAMCLDHMPAVKGDYDSIAESLKRTYEWAQRCKKVHGGKSIYGKKQMVFGIAQGGLFKDLREQSAKDINSLDFDGNAMGGLALGESSEEMYKAIEWQVPFLDEKKPRYLMGVGSPADLVEAVSRGVDCFDSIYPTQNARHCHLFTNDGMIKLDRGKYREDFGPIDPECDCYVCRNFTRAYLHHLSRSSEWTHHRYLSYHNVYFILQLMKKIRLAISKGEFNEFKKEFLKRFKKNKK
ncbi:tRNA guanosine(34) transglycosylase Tgt [Candidatus Woesearchaeota archaeon]|jgi:queuine tRNA-ribosyltransferase|nr:tRNA guanosine(34) transglycosylase Tgt [Candidatus Woesearchaeota archaeon]MBT6519423.1 tRNA guanosine(34) transglycosylase Tgt [Candidatus Woesearchaeota archaeon]MBT7368916.1 tRNA guanosine(34) transglycosylase Tgt [Candidatus Woesearchaeota archaeon]